MTANMSSQVHMPWCTWTCCFMCLRKLDPASWRKSKIAKITMLAHFFSAARYCYLMLKPTVSALTVLGLFNVV